MLTSRCFWNLCHLEYCRSHLQCQWLIKSDCQHCHLPFSFLYLDVIRDVINYLKKGFSLERGIFLIPWYLPRYTEFSRTNTPAMGKKLKNLGNGKKYPFYQPIKRQHSYIWWNYLRKYNSSPLIRPLSPKGHPSYKATHQKATPLIRSFSPKGHPSYKATHQKATPLIRPLSPKGQPSYKATHQKATPLIRPVSPKGHPSSMVTLTKRPPSN